MSQQLKSVITWSDASGDPNSNVNAARLTSSVVDSTLTNAAITEQIESAAPLDADSLLLGDSTAGPSGVPKRVLFGKLRASAQQYAADTGAANAYLVTLDPAPAAYTAGMIVRMKALHANTLASTLNVNGLGAKSIVTTSGGALVAGQILTGQMVEMEYDGANNFQLKNPSQTAAAAAQYAADTGTANTYFVALNPAPEAYYAGMVVQFKALNANTGASTLSVNGMTSKSITHKDGSVLVKNDVVVGQIVTLVYDGTNFQFTTSRVGWNFISDGTAGMPAPSAVLNLPHGLGVVPTRYRVVLFVPTGAGAQNGYAEGDEADINMLFSTANGVILQVAADATNIVISRSTASPQIIPKAGGGVATLAAGWKVKAYVSL